MFSNIIRYAVKRDGRVVPFDDGCILSAILKAMAATDAGVDEGLADFVTQKVVRNAEALCGNDNTDMVSVEQVHELVEEALMGSPRKDVAQEYIRYREKRNLARKADTRAIFDSIVRAQANEITRENANMNADTPAGMMMKFASESSKTYTIECLLSEDVRRAVKDNLLHIHDLDYYPTRSLTCIQHPTDRILRDGFVDGHASVRPSKRLETAATVACISMEAVQNEMHGGQAIPAFDFYLAPYVRKAYEEEVMKIGQSQSIRRQVFLEELCPDDFLFLRGTCVKDYIERGMLDEKACVFSELRCDEDIVRYVEEMHADDDADLSFRSCDYFRIAITLQNIKTLAVNRTVRRVHQAMESFVHNMNTIHSRGGNQVVFSSINYGTDTSPEGRCIIREILNTTYEGVGNGETAIFPIQIWKKKRGVSYLPGDPNYDLYCFAAKVTARRFFPHYLNLDASFNRDDAWRADDPLRYEHEVATMGCRTRVYENRFGPKTSIARGNLSFSTVNLPGLAIRTMLDAGRPFGQADEQVLDGFFANLEVLLDLAARQLHERFLFQSGALAKQFPMLMSGLWIGSDGLAPTDPVGPVLNQGTLGIGFIGLAECLIALVGKHHAESSEAQELGLEIVTFMRDKVNAFSEHYQHNYSVLATPAEGLSGKFTRVDRKRYGVIEGVTDKEYYTNSNHVPVYFHCTPEEKARVEGPYHDLTRGGHIFYVEMDGDATHNPEAIMQVVDLMDRYDIGYGSVNHNRARCLDCGYESAEKGLKVCPRCGGSRIDLLQRITGYLVGTTDRWNSGKKAELRDRVVHK